MINLKLSGGRQPLYVLGLSAGNVEELKQGHPIKPFNLRDLGGPDVLIAIHYGETEVDIAREFQALGVLPPDMPLIAAAPGEVRVVRRKSQVPHS